MRQLFIFLCLSFSISFAQQNNDTGAFEVTNFRGNVLPHTPDLYHLAGHTDGVMLSYIMQTHGAKEWHSAYQFPDYGGYFLYENFNNNFLGKTYSVGMEYNFYFFNRNLMFKLAQGVAYASNPYNKETNSKNKAFGSTLLDNTNIGLYYKKPDLFGKLGLQAGFLFSHFSNGRTKSPNSGINTLSLNVGFNYNFDDKIKNDTLLRRPSISYREPIKYNFVLRTGFNESPIINSGRFPFYHIGAYADKRFNRKSAIQLGTEVFLTTSFKDFIKYKAYAYPELNISPNTDYKRVGAFVGYELFVNKISLEAQLGYYIYDPFKNEISIYDRVGMKYYFTKKVFGGFTIKTHMFLAEALEFGIGVRL